MNQTKFNVSKMKQIRRWRIEILSAEDFRSLKIMKKGSSYRLLSNSWFWVIQHFQQAIFQCAIDEFTSFLRRWIPFIKCYNLIYLDFYHAAVLMCVFDVFNCINQNEMMIEFWTAFEPWFFATSNINKSRFSSSIKHFRLQQSCNQSLI